MKLEDALAWADKNTKDPAVVARLKSRAAVKALADAVRAFQAKEGVGYRDKLKTACCPYNEACSYGGTE